jgi:uncharacterized MnhB-related membrane protein
MKINYLAIAACIFVNMGLGMSWYGVFGEAWMAGHGFTMAQVEANASASPYIATIIAAVVSGYVLSLLYQRMNVKGWQDGAITGAAIGSLLFFATVASYLFSQKSLSLAVLDGGYMFVLFVLYGALIGGWQKKE